MNLDEFSPTTPAHLKSLVLPVGRTRQSRFSSFVRRLQKENVVRLGDVSPDARPNRTMFSPLAFPDGLVHYDISPSVPPSSQNELVPFEVYRSPLLVIGIADWKELNALNSSKEDGQEPLQLLETLSRDLETLRVGYSTALLHRILIFDVEKGVQDLGPDIVVIPPLAQSRTTTIKTVLCDLTSTLLAEMSSYAKHLQEKSTIETPKSTATDLSNGVASSIPSHMSQSTRPMSAAFGFRSNSPTVDERADHRMSMPVYGNQNSHSGSSTPNRYGSPPRPGNSTPPFRSEEVLATSADSPPRKPSLDRRTLSHERLPTTGSAFGSSNLGELDRDRGKARVGVVVGSLYLLAGRWPDAMRELSRSASTARSSSDYVWQAKAMDYLIVCLLVSAWAGMDFKIPDVLRSPSALLHTGSGKASKHSPSNSQHEITLSRPSDPATLTTTLQSLAQLLPDLIYNILNLYSRARSFTDDKIPLSSFYQSTIRLARLMSVLHTFQSELNKSTLDYLVLGNSLVKHDSKLNDAIPVQTRIEVVNLLLRAYPVAASEPSMSAAERISVLAAIAGTLINLNRCRKATFVLREILTLILPSLVQARKDDAAEMGVHPAASLSTLNAMTKASTSSLTSFTITGSEAGVQALLQLACQVNGIPFPALNNQTTLESSYHGHEVGQMAMRQAVLSHYGALDLKLDTLRACINVCEALPSLAGALQYSAVLLRIAGSGIAPAPESSNGAAVLAIDEQERLASSISRTLGAAQHLGLDDLEADYWDDFLIRGIELVEGGDAPQLVAHAKTELDIVKSQESKTQKDPFIFNPFLKAKSTSKVSVLVAGDQVSFRVMLQNLLDFEIVVDRLELLIDGIKAMSPSQTVSVGSYRTQTIIVYVVPQESGEMILKGCRAKIRGCRERAFRLFTEAWALKSDIKGRNLFLNMANDDKHDPPGESNQKARSVSQNSAPTTDLPKLKVIPSQPTLTLDSIDLPQDSINLLDGERKRLKMRLRNLSSDKPADFLLLSTTDSSSASVQDARGQKEIRAADLYELELDVQQAALSLVTPLPVQELFIEPSSFLDIDIEVFAKRSLAFGTVQADYCYLGRPVSEVVDQFYTRQISLPLSMTVSASILLTAIDILPANKDLGLMPPVLQRSVPKLGNNSYQSAAIPRLTETADFKDPSNPCCLLILDFHNSHFATLTLHLEVATAGDKSVSLPQCVSHNILTGTESRIPVLVPRTYLQASKAHAPIPALNPASKRQFVVSPTATSIAEEREAREAFWYRESILSTLKAHWSEESTNRTGTIDLRRGLKLTTAMTSAYKLPDVSLSMSVAAADGWNVGPNEEKAARTVSANRCEVATSMFLTLRTRLYNRSQDPIRSILRLQPSLANQPSEAALDLHRKLLVNGLSQRVIPTLEPESEQIVETGFVVLNTGVYDWNASVEELVTASEEDDPELEEAGKPKGRKRGKTGELDLSVPHEERRTWVMERPFVMLAQEKYGHSKNIDVA